MFLSKIWDKISNLGFDKSLSFEDTRDLRLLNSLVFIITLFFLIVTCFILLPNINKSGFTIINQTALAHNLTSIGMGLIILRLNYIKSRNTSKIIAVPYYFLYFFYSSYVDPQPIFSELFLLIWLSIVYIIFQNNYIILFFTFIGISSNTIIIYRLSQIHPEAYKPLHMILLWEIFGFVTLSICLRIFKSQHEIYQKIIEISNNHLNIQKEELLQLNDKLKESNEYLDQKVEERTQDLLAVNNKLVHYHFMNAHQLRAPLARIFGFINLLNYSSSVEEQKDLLEKLTTAAHELDRVTDEIRETLENAEKRAVDIGRSM